MTGGPREERINVALAACPLVNIMGRARRPAWLKGAEPPRTNQTKENRNLGRRKIIFEGNNGVTVTITIPVSVARPCPHLLKRGPQTLANAAHLPTCSRSPLLTFRRHLFSIPASGSMMSSSQDSLYGFCDNSGVWAEAVPCCYQSC